MQDSEEVKTITINFKISRDNIIKLENLSISLSFIDITRLLNEKLDINKYKPYEYIYKGKNITDHLSTIDNLGIRDNDIIALIIKKINSSNPINNFIFSIENLTGSTLRIENVSDFNSLFNSFMGSSLAPIGNNFINETINNEPDDNSNSLDGSNISNESNVSAESNGSAESNESAESGVANTTASESNGDNNQIEDNDDNLSTENLVNNENGIEISEQTLESFFSQLGSSGITVNNSVNINPEETLFSMGYTDRNLNRMALQYNYNNLEASIEWLEQLR